MLDPVLLPLSNGNCVIFTIEKWVPEEPESCKTVCKKPAKQKYFKKNNNKKEQFLGAKGLGIDY